MTEKVYHRWTPEMIDWLRENYQEKGDKELAEIMNIIYPHKNKWKLKHIEKRRSYSGLKRTAEQVFILRSEMNKNIDRSKMWDKRGRKQDGEIVKWNHCGSLVEYIKIENKFIRLSRFVWEKEVGKIPAGFNVVLIDRNGTAADIKNLMMISNAELAALNSKNRLPEELRETKKLITTLNKIINEKQNFGFKQSSVRTA